MTEVAGKVALVTGGVSGIGLGIAHALGKAGAKVIVTYRRAEHLEEAQRCFRSSGLTVHALRLDVTDRDAVLHAADEAEGVFGKIHILCNNAGVNLLGPMDEAGFEVWDWILGVNLHGVINALVSFLPKIRRHGEGGHIVNVASMGSFISGPNAGIYGTSKFAVRGLSEALRLNLAPQRIGVSLVCPGLTQSRIYEAPCHGPPKWRTAGPPADPRQLKRLAAVHAAGMKAEEVGNMTVRAVAENRFYVFTHPEFKQELQELCDEILRAVPDGVTDPRREAFESLRRQTTRRARLVAAEFEQSQ